MAWTEQLPNGNYRACWRDASGRKRSISLDPRTHKPFAREKAAQRVADDKEEHARWGELGADGRAPRWGDWCPIWLASRVVEPSTARQDKVRVDRYLIPQWGNRRLNTITRSQVQAWVNDLARAQAHVAVPKRKPDGWQPPEPRTLSPSTVDRILRLFSASMKAAVLDETTPLLASPCAGIKLAPPAPGHERYLSRAEVDTIAYYLGEPHKTAWLILVGTGLRYGEMAGLHWQRVDTAARLIDVVETWDAADQKIKAYPKGKKRRSVPIPAWLLPVLAAQIDRQGTPARSCGLRHAAGARCRSGLVLTAPGGGALDGHNFGERDFASAVARAGLGRVRLHDARHTYASWLVQKGIPLQEVQRLLGHASIVTTQRYSHLGTSQNAAVLAVLDEI